MLGSIFTNEEEETKTFMTDSDITDNNSYYEEKIKLDNLKIDNLELDNLELDNLEIDEIKSENDVTCKPFVEICNKFLTQDKSILSKFDLELTPEIQQFVLSLCKESPDLLETIDETLKNIMLDEKIDTKDIPNFLILVKNVYNIIIKTKGIPNIEPYDLIKILLHLILVIHFNTNKVNYKETLTNLLTLVDTSIDLIKLTPFLNKKNKCFLRC
jgi:hypothetical protein